MSAIATRTDANWLTLVPAAGLTRRSIGIPAGLFYVHGDLQGDATGGIVQYRATQAFEIKNRWVLEWQAVMAASSSVAAAFDCLLQLPTAPQVQDITAQGFTNPVFAEAALGLIAGNSGSQTWTFGLGNAGRTPLLSWGTKNIPGVFLTMDFIWETNTNLARYSVAAWGFYYANQQLFRGLPPGVG